MGTLNMWLLSASKLDMCMRWRWLLTDPTFAEIKRSPNFVGLGTTVNINHPARTSDISHPVCISLNFLIPS